MLLHIPVVSSYFLIILSLQHIIQLSSHIAGSVTIVNDNGMA